MSGQTGVKGLYKRGNKYHADFFCNGTRHRLALRTSDFEVALLRFETEKEKASDPPTLNWVEKIALENADTLGQRKVKSIAKSLLDGAIARAKSRNHPMLLTIDDVNKLLIRSRGTCEVTGVPFTLSKISRGRRSPFAPSLDKIDPTKLYDLNNCRVVCVAVNIALSDWGESVFRQLAVGYCRKHVMV